MLLVNFPFYGWGQFKFTKKTHQFGKVSNWENPVVHFQFVNQGETSVRFLPTHNTRDLKIWVPPYPIPPGDSGSIKVTYYTDRQGPFRERFTVSHSASQDPVRLALTGEIVSFSPNAQMECPTVGTGTRQTSSTPDKSYYQQRGKVVDSIDKSSIQGAAVRFESVKQKSFRDQTNRRGKFRLQIPPGRYQIRASARGYYPKKLPLRYLKRNAQPIEIELVPKYPREKSPTAHQSNPSPPDTSQPPERDRNKDRAERGEKKKREDPVTVFPLPFRDQGEEEEDTEEAAPDTVPPAIHDLPDVTNGTLSSKKYRPNNIIFLIDVSVSMDDPYKLPWLRPAMKQLVDLLRTRDQLAIIKYSAYPHMVVPSQTVQEKDTIHRLIDSLKVMGMTDAVLGIKKAYEVAEENFRPKANNQIILASDGLFDKGKTNRDLHKMVEDKAEKGIKLSVVGFGNEEDSEEIDIDLMKKFAREGRGSFIHITSPDAAKNVLIEDIKKHSIKHQVTQK